MKKGIIRIIIAFFVGSMVFSVVTGTFSDADSVDAATRLNNPDGYYPIYESLSEQDKDLYKKLCTAIEEYDTDPITIGYYSSYEEMSDGFDNFKYIYKELMFEQPQYFWTDWYDAEYEIINKGYRAYATIDYTVEEKDLEIMKGTLDVNVKSVVSGAQLKDTTFDKIKYVYDYICDNTEYDTNLAENGDNPLGYTAYGCLVDGKTVCSGYTRAFSLIMNELGINCGYEYDKLAQAEIFSNGHIWNYCEIDSEYYYFDVTWDDTTFETYSYKPYIDHSYMYFGITRDELSRTHNRLRDDAITPECNGTRYNYFEMTGANFSNYNADEVKNYILSAAGNNCIAMRFDTTDATDEAVKELMDNGKIHEIIKYADNIRYVTPSSGHHLYLLIDY